MNPFEKILKSKTYFTRDINKQIKIYALDKNSNEAHVIGSMSYRSGNASDVDLFEETLKDNREAIINFFAKNIKNIVSKLQKVKGQYFLEVKLGQDDLYSDVFIGTCANDTYSVPPSLFNVLKSLYTKGLLTSEEYEIIKGVEQEPTKTQIHYEIIKKIMRKHTVLRWTSKEINLGYKWLIDDEGEKYKYYIEDAVQDKGQINVEGIFINADNKYVDCSNFFVLMYKDAEGVEHMLNLPENALTDEANFRRENLKQSMYTLMYSKLEPNLFKVLKRMLSYGKSFQDVQLIEYVYPIINSQLGVLYNLTSQLKTCAKTLKDHKSKYLYKETLYHTLDSIRFKLQELIFVNYDFREIVKLIELALSDMKVKESELSEMIDVVTKNLMKFLNHQTEQKMIKAGLYPLPPHLTPSVKPF